MDQKSDLKPLLILGCGEFAVEVLEIAEYLGRTVLGFVHSSDDSQPRSHLGLPVSHVSSLDVQPLRCELITAIVSPARNAIIDMMASRGYTFCSLVHPRAFVSPRATIGRGTVVCAGAIVSPNTRVADHVLVNRSTSIGHDNVLERFSTVGPGAVLAGSVSVGEGVFIGAGATIKDHLTIGARAFIGAGSVVTKCVNADEAVGGHPARDLTALNGRPHSPKNHAAPAAIHFPSPAAEARRRS
jgi:sugar O-acyltransferase (sialic acid O-acetyltransferase NeuD family)